MTVAGLVGAVLLGEQVDDVASPCAVQDGRLVDEQDFGGQDECAGESGALALDAGELGRAADASFAHADGVEDFVRKTAGVGAESSGDVAGQQELLACGEGGQ